jgi:hypothetical protein
VSTDEKLVTLNVGIKFVTTLATIEAHRPPASYPDTTTTTLVGFVDKAVEEQAENELVGEHFRFGPLTQIASSPSLCSVSSPSNKNKDVARRREEVVDVPYGPFSFPPPSRQPVVTTRVDYDALPVSARASVLGFSADVTCGYDVCDDLEQQDVTPASAAEDSTAVFQQPSDVGEREPSKREKTPSLSSSPSSRSSSSSYPSDKQQPTRTATGSTDRVVSDLEVFLDRSPGSYDVVLHFLRTKDLPRSVRVPDESIHVLGDGGGGGGFRHLLTMRLKDARDEARWLGLVQLEHKCEAELEKLRVRRGERTAAEDGRENWI